MKNLILFLCVFPILLFGNDNQAPSKIKEVTIYLNGAQITRLASFNLKAGSSEITFTDLSTKIDENSIQISGLQSVSILSMAYDINFLPKTESSPHFLILQLKLDAVQSKISLLKNTIIGLKEEEKVITANRMVSSETQVVNLEVIKQISTYYRERITAIKNEIYTTNLEINLLGYDLRAIKNELKELNKALEKEQGELMIKFDAPIATSLNLSITYLVSDAGWIPNYDIKSKSINTPLNLSYKAHVYQKTGVDWNGVNIVLSTGNPNFNVSKPNLSAKYLNFSNGWTSKTQPTKKQRYVYNPTVKKVTGIVTDNSGEPLPGANIMVSGTSKGVQTDFDGYYSIDIEEGQELEMSYLGFNTARTPIFSSVMNIRLEENAEMLEEVVVTAMSTNTESSNYALSSVLQGKVSGIRIRGIGSIKGRYHEPKPPLYIIDGIPVEGFIEGDLDESEIQSVEVLEGSKAQAIYGSQGSNGVIVVTTKKSKTEDDVTQTKFIIKKPCSIVSDGDITTIEINTFKLKSEYEYFAVPIVNENVFLTASFKDWEDYNLLPGEASIYFNGSYSGKTTIDPYTVKKEMIVSLGIEPNITVTRKRSKNFKSKSFMGSNRILDRTYELEVKNNMSTSINLKLMDRIPLSQNKEIKVDDIVTFAAEYDKKKGLLTWKMNLGPKKSKKESFSFKIKHPKYRSISL